MEDFVVKNLNERNRLEGGNIIKVNVKHDGRQCIQIVLVRI
jgi:hypothetical protein